MTVFVAGVVGGLVLAAGVGVSRGNVLAGFRAGVIAPGRLWGRLVLVARGECSGERGECPDRVQDDGELVLPGPAGGHPEGPLSAGARQPAGDPEQMAAS